jgi:hypothetical protein
MHEPNFNAELEKRGTADVESAIDLGEFCILARRIEATAWILRKEREADARYVRCLVAIVAVFCAMSWIVLSGLRV